MPLVTLAEKAGFFQVSIAGRVVTDGEVTPVAALSKAKAVLDQALREVKADIEQAKQDEFLKNQLNLPL